MCQNTVTIFRPEFSTTTTVYLQKNFPLDLLQGMDVQKALGIQVVLTTEGKMVDLLTGMTKFTTPGQEQTCRV